MSDSFSEMPLWRVPTDDVWVVCPRCSELAFVTNGRLLCGSCGLRREAPPTPGTWSTAEQRWDGPYPAEAEEAGYRAIAEGVCSRTGERSELRLVMPKPAAPNRRVHVAPCACGGDRVIANLRFESAPVADAADRIFRCPMWLQRRCAGHTLWAANPRHLDYLTWFISQSVRPSVGLGTVLPKWMIVSTNRDRVLTGLTKLCAGAALYHP